jgi:membrane dipeptidase
MIRLLASKGGVMGINFYGHFLGGDEFSRIDDMIRHIKHIKKVGGIDVLSLGSDFDGIDSTLEIENIGEIHKLIYALQKNNFTDDEIDKILYKNTLRVLKEIG